MAGTLGCGNSGEGTALGSEKLATPGQKTGCIRSAGPPGGSESYAFSDEGKEGNWAAFHCESEKKGEFALQVESGHMSWLFC